MYFENCYSSNVVVTPSAILYTHLCYAKVTMSHRTHINGETLCFLNCMSERNLTWPQSQIFSHGSRAALVPGLLFVDRAATGISLSEIYWKVLKLELIKQKPLLHHEKQHCIARQHPVYFSRDLCCAVQGRGQLKCDGTRAKIRLLLSPKRTRPFKSAGASVQSTTGSRGLRISGSNAEHTMFRGSVKGTGYPLYSPLRPHPCVTVCHHISTGV